MKIKLTKEEENIFNAIKKYIEISKDKIVPRVAGGWVRDKLLNIKSYDIDITLDTISGYEFAKRLKDSKIVNMSGISVIKENPLKSKHLEIAAVRINQMQIDFIQLRTEEYLDGTRIPSIEVGDPIKDAYRRDITINSLFYNILTEKVEDYTEMGLNDLKNKIIRTPLEPLKTFLDDPLRILRVFRFASRFNFMIEKSIYDVLRNLDVQEALKQKVSYERIGIEMNKLLSEKNCRKYLVDFIEFDLVEPIFKYQISCKNRFQKAKIYLDCTQIIQEKQVDMFLVNLYIICQFFVGQKDIYMKKDVPVSYIIAKKYFSWPNCMTKRIMQIEENIMFLKTIDFDKIIDNRFEAIKIVRKLKEEWENSILIYHSIIEAENCLDQSKKILTMHEYLLACNLENAYKTKPIVNGVIIKENFDINDSKIAHYIERGIILQIYYNISDIKELLDMMKTDPELII